MKKLLTILCTTLLLALTGCQHEEPLVEPETVTGQEFNAQIEEFNAATKTELANNNSVVWSEGDQIAIFQGTSSADKYQVNEDCVGNDNGTFRIVAKGGTNATSNFPANIALYPYKDDLTCSPTVENGEITSYHIEGVTFPSTQTYVAGSFPNDSFMMAAITDGINDHTLNFRNLCGALKLQLKGTAKIKTIELKGNDNEPLAGEATVTIYPDGTAPSLTMSEKASTTVTLNCGDGVQLNETTATDFLITVPPTAFEKGFTVTITSRDGGIAKIETTKPNTIERSYIHTMPESTVEAQYDPAREYFRGKKLWVFGDSITAGVGTTSPYYFAQILCENMGFASLKRSGHSGNAFSHGIDDYGYTILDKMESALASAPGNCDVLIICFGVNDWTWGRNIEGDRAIGSATDETKYTICGAVNLFCQKLQTIFADQPDVEIYFATPTPTKNSPISGGNPGGKSWDQSKQNYNGNTLRDICNAIAERAKAHGYGVLDLNRYFSENINGVTDPDEIFPDGLHPNEEGNKVIASVLEELLLNSYEIESDPETESSYGLITQLTAGMQYHPGEVSGPKGTLNVNSSYNSWSYTVPNDCKIFVDNDVKSIYAYFSISVVPEGSSSGIRYRFYSTEDTLPTIDEPLEVSAGSTIYVSVRNTIFDWAFYTSDQIITSAGTDIMDAVASNQLILRHTFISNELQNLLILKKCSGRDDLFLGQKFMKIVDNNINSNCWRLGTLDLYKRIGNEFVIYKSGIIISGEWECAIKESGAEDFLGGNAHGDEQLIEINAELDGKTLDFSSSFVTIGYTLDIIRHSILNRCNTPGDNVIDHMVSYTITPESITINQTAEWLQDMVIETSYLLMCPISRTYTSSAKIEDQSEIVDISYAGHSRPSISGNKGEFSLWGENFSAKIEYECLEGATSKAFSFISPSSSPAYNKFYYNFVGSNVQESVKAGHRVTTYGKISYSYNE